MATPILSSHVWKLLKAAKAAHGAGKRRLHRELVRRYLQSYEARRHAVITANAALPVNRRVGKKAVEKIAEDLNAWKGSKESVTVHMKRKESGTHRLYADFGIENRALQYLVLPLLTDIADLHALQFEMRGGVPAAIDHVQSMLKQGFEWAIETDIAEFFPSFDGAELQQVLPLPKEVIRNVLIAENLTLVLGDDVLYYFGPAGDDEGAPSVLSEILAQARRGIPHGSATSSILAELLLAPVFKSLKCDERIANYADNILIMAKSEADVVSMTSAMWSAIEAHPVGHLRPKEEGRSKPGEPVEFLGHILKKVDHIVMITPTSENYETFRRRVRRGLDSIRHQTSSNGRFRKAAELTQYVVSWCGSYSRTHNAEFIRQYFLSKIATSLEASQ